MEKHELQELGVSSFEKLRRAIEEGDREKSLRLLDDVVDKFGRYRTFFVDWVDMALTTLAQRVGEEAVYELMRAIDRRYVRPLIAVDAGAQSPEDRARTRAHVWTALHNLDIEIEEDAEKFIFKIPCASGGRLRSKPDHGKTEKPYPWSHGEEGFCYYCVHCVASFEIMPIEEYGYPAWMYNPRPEGGRCIQLIYKDPRAVPEEYYARVGMKKEG